MGRHLLREEAIAKDPIAASASKPDHAMAEVNKLAGVIAGVPTPAREVLGTTFLGEGYLAVSSGTTTDKIVREYIEEPEGEQIADEGRFPIDNP
jgi:hypothetical protein